MAKFFKPKQKEISSKHFSVKVIDIDIKGRSVCKDATNPKVTWFVEGGLLGEELIVRTKDLKKDIGIAEIISVKSRSNDRVSPKCKYYAQCGGCSLQHMPIDLEINAKVSGLKRLFQKNLGLDIQEPEKVEYGNEYSYRRVCRLSTVGDKNSFSIGMRKAYDKKIIEIDECSILEEDLSALIPTIRETFLKLGNYKLIGHVELVKVDSGIVVLIRVINNLSERDLGILREFAKNNKVEVFLQIRHEKQANELEDREIIINILDNTEKPYYMIDGVKISFLPTDFIQINENVNKVMVETALDYLNVNKEDHVLDLFCGLGNFSLPIAKRAAHVYAIEGVWNMVRAGNENAKDNNLYNIEFIVHDLEEDFENTVWAKSKITKALLDPGRNGAQRVSTYLVKRKIDDIVYVSCNPLTLLRDLKIFLQADYKIQKWSVFDMFPKTEHVETVVLLSRDKA